MIIIIEGNVYLNKSKCSIGTAAVLSKLPHEQIKQALLILCEQQLVPLRKVISIFALYFCVQCMMNIFCSLLNNLI